MNLSEFIFKNPEWLFKPIRIWVDTFLPEPVVNLIYEFLMGQSLWEHKQKTRDLLVEYKSKVLKSFIFYSPYFSMKVNNSRLFVFSESVYYH